ncbi:MAG: hypothetical protein GY930_17335 [bacterium]|nr:hypothetical protein [bacterium]
MGTSATGTAMGTGYPVPGYGLRLGVRFSTGGNGLSLPIGPGDEVYFDGVPLPDKVGKSLISIDWHWQYSQVGVAQWIDIPGMHTTEHLIYTLFGEPEFAAGQSGTQYAGPWVEVLDHVSRWSEELGFDTGTDTGLVEAFVQGFVSGTPGNPLPIENMRYDTVLLGGGSGFSNYFDSGAHRMNLSALLNGAAHGFFFNCSDNMGCSTTMLAMIDVPDMRPIRLDLGTGTSRSPCETALPIRRSQMAARSHAQWICLGAYDVPSFRGGPV